MIPIEMCPHCNTEFTIRKFGRHIPCPHCKQSLDIFPDADIWIDTPWGEIGFSAGPLTMLLEKIIIGEPDKR